MTDCADTILSSLDDNAVLTIRLNQPKKKNAISVEMMQTLKSIFYQADCDDSIRAIVLRGEGETFCSGGDLSQGIAATRGPAGSRASLRHYQDAVRAVRRCSKPTIAMIDGYAVGGGFSLALSCDLLYASDRAIFVPAFCQIGIAPEMGIVKHLCEIVGPQRAKEILFLGGKIPASNLHTMGLINGIFPAGRLEEQTLEIATRIAAMPKQSVQTTKLLANALMDGMLEAELEMESYASPLCGAIKAFGSRSSE